MMPEQAASSPGRPPRAGQPAAKMGWKRRLVSLLTALTCLSAGTMLVLLPWGESWGRNYFSGSNPAWYSVWMNSYFRGAIGGIGALNLYVALAELASLARGLRS
jgi:hypothetical protein